MKYYAWKKLSTGEILKTYIATSRDEGLEQYVPMNQSKVFLPEMAIN
jgi:hypothetical protein